MILSCAGSSAVEQRVYTPLAPDKRQVAGSNPARRTNFKNETIKHYNTNISPSFLCSVAQRE